MSLITTVTIHKNGEALCYKEVKDFKSFIAFVKPFVKGSYNITRVTRIK